MRKYLEYKKRVKSMGHDLKRVLKDGIPCSVNSKTEEDKEQIPKNESS